MAEINLDLDYFEHPKTIRLMGRLGKGAAELPLRLWVYTGKFHAKDGVLTGYSVSDIEAVVKWWGKRGECVAAMVGVKFLDQLPGGTYAVHNWTQRAGHIYAFKEAGKALSKKRWVKAPPPQSGTQSGTQCEPQSVPHTGPQCDTQCGTHSAPQSQCVTLHDNTVRGGYSHADTFARVNNNTDQPTLSASQVLTAVVDAYLEAARLPVANEADRKLFHKQNKSFAEELLVQAEGNLERAKLCIQHCLADYKKRGIKTFNLKFIVDDYRSWNAGRIEYEQKISKP